MRPKRALRNVLLFATGLSVAYLLGCWQLARSYVEPDRQNEVLPQGFRAETWEHVGGSRTPVWTNASWQDKGSEVRFLFVHGYRGSRMTFVEVMEEMDRRGIAASSLSLPGHGSNPEGTSTLGRKESERVAATAKRIRADWPESKIVLVGLSMGAASCWLASEIEPDSIDGIVSDASFARLDEAIRSYFDRTVWGGRYLLAPVSAMASRMAGSQPSRIVPVDAARKWRGKPSLVLVGEWDRVVPEGHSQSLGEAAGCEVWIVPGARHAECHTIDQSRFLDRILQFAADL